MSNLHWLAMVVLTFLAFQFVQLIYVLLQALIGRMGGAVVEAISLGCGPMLFRRNVAGVDCRLSAIPWGAYTKFANTGSTEGSDGVQEYSAVTSGKRFEELSISIRILTMLAGPCSALMVGLVCTAIPVYMHSDQVLVDESSPARWPHSAVPGLTIAPQTTTWDGQWQLLNATYVRFFVKIVTFQSLSGWGGFVGWASTLGSVGADSFSAWLSCFGVTIIGLGATNLLPIPVLNGGHIVFLLLEPVLRDDHPIRGKLTLAGFILLLFVMLMIIIADFMWLNSFVR